MSARHNRMDTTRHTPISVTVIWAVTILRLLAAAATVGLVIWLASCEPTGALQEGFRSGALQRFGSTDGTFSAFQAGQVIGAAAIPAVFSGLLLLALRYRRRGAVRGLLAAQMVLALGQVNAAALVVSTVLLILTFTRGAKACLAPDWLVDSGQNPTKSRVPLAAGDLIPGPFDARFAEP